MMPSGCWWTLRSRCWSAHFTCVYTVTVSYVPRGPSFLTAHHLLLRSLTYAYGTVNLAYFELHEISHKIQKKIRAWYLWGFYGLLVVMAVLMHLRLSRKKSFKEISEGQMVLTHKTITRRRTCLLILTKYSESDTFIVLFYDKFFFIFATWKPWPWRP
jgi:hypothetical protein